MFLQLMCINHIHKCTAILYINFIYFQNENISKWLKLHQYNVTVSIAFPYTTQENLENYSNIVIEL